MRASDTYVNLSHAWYKLLDVGRSRGEVVADERAAVAAAVVAEGERAASTSFRLLSGEDGGP